MIINRDMSFRVVCNIRTPDGLGKENVGTGIFMCKEEAVWIVTASHVAKETKVSTYIALGNVNSDCTIVQLTDFNSKLDWVHHAVADISIIKIDVNSDNSKYLENRCLPFDHFNVSNICVSRDSELTSIGFPNGLGIQGKFSPLTFRSYASSSFLTLNRADTKKPQVMFCLENPSVGGYSGCPVFDLGYMVVGAMTTTKEKTICHGIMHGTMNDNTGGKIALVTPCYYLNDLIN